MKKKRSKRNKYNNRSKRITKKRKGILKKRKISNKKKRGGMDSVTVAIDPFVTEILEATKLTQYKENLKGVSWDDLFDIETFSELNAFLKGKQLKSGHVIKFKKELKNYGWSDLGTQQPLTEFEKECMHVYCKWDSDPFNFKLRGIKYADVADYSMNIIYTVLTKHGKTIDDMIEGISSAIKKSVVTKTVIIYRGFDIESIASFSRLDPAFKSFTTDIYVILDTDFGSKYSKYINDNGCCVLRTILKRGMYAYYDEDELQYVLDKDTMFSEPRLVKHDGFYSMYDVDILESQ
tara:strand:- start:115 stop:990 length:876 start_codon:yes stop_codon:yes gene_type:complete